MKILKSKYLWTTLSILAIIAIFPFLMPKPIDMDLAKIGNGQKSVVFIYDLNLGVSNQQTIEMNKARDTLGDKAIFLIAKAGDPKSETFMTKYKARSAELLFFNGEGQLIERQIALIETQDLVEKLLAK